VAQGTSTKVRINPGLYSIRQSPIRKRPSFTLRNVAAIGRAFMSTLEPLVTCSRRGQGPAHRRQPIGSLAGADAFMHLRRHAAEAWWRAPWSSSNSAIASISQHRTVSMKGLGGAPVMLAAYRLMADP